MTDQSEPLLSNDSLQTHEGAGSEHELQTTVSHSADIRKDDGKDYGATSVSGSGSVVSGGASSSIRHRKLARKRSMMGAGHLDARAILKKKEKEELIKDFFGHHEHYPDPSPKMRKFVEDLESLDYEEDESIVHQIEMHKKTIKWSMRVEVMKWLACLVIGIGTGLVAFLIDFFVKIIAVYKFKWVNDVYNMTGHSLFPSILLYMGISTALVSVAGALVSFVEHLAAGSGIPEIKCYLNGVRMPRILRLRTLVAKAVGVLFSVAGGLAVGKEGPMIHSGAIVAAGVSQGQSLTLGLNMKTMNPFKNDHDKRDFVSCGAAAGVAAAFGAPIGGVLFSLEEGSSFWNQMLTWRSFFSAMIATFTLNIFLSGTTGHWGDLSQPGLLSFGSFSSDSQGAYQLFEIPFFILMGALGGLLGALFNHLNRKLTIWRMKHITNNWRKFGEAVLAGLVTSFVMFLIPQYYYYCFSSSQLTTIPPQQFNCGPNQYNDMATLFFTRQEDTIKQLFHSNAVFSVGTLIVVFVALFLLACVTYGVSVPSGLFVPSIMVGCAYGRLVGHLLHYFWEDLDPGTYALIGAAAFLGGVVRMTISLTVIIIESTNDIKYGLPIMIAIVVAKWVGDLFNPGLYDIHVELKHIPFIEWEAPAVMNTLITTDIMSSDVVTVNQICRVGDVIRKLETTSHNGFPVVDIESDENSTVMDEDYKGAPKPLVGMISRHQLVVLMANNVFGVTPQLAKRAHRISVKLFEADYPRYRDIDSLAVQDHEMDYFMDLRPYMSNAPHSVPKTATLTRVFRLFRSLGLRHLAVVDSENNVVGIITRKDMTHGNCLKALMNLQTLDTSHLMESDVIDAIPVDDEVSSDIVENSDDDGHEDNLEPPMRPPTATISVVGDKNQSPSVTPSSFSVQFDERD